MDGFSNPLLKKQIKDLIGDQPSPIDRVRSFFKSKPGWDVTDAGLITINDKPVGEVVSSDLCEDGHVHARVKMYYEFIIPEDTDEFKGFRS